MMRRLYAVLIIHCIDCSLAELQNHAYSAAAEDSDTSSAETKAVWSTLNTL
jgi:hypothetical protein